MKVRAARDALRRYGDLPDDGDALADLCTAAPTGAI
jgi:hypothetical protein